MVEIEAVIGSPLAISTNSHASPVEVPLIRPALVAANRLLGSWQGATSALTARVSDDITELLSSRALQLLPRSSVLKVLSLWP